MSIFKKEKNIFKRIFKKRSKLEKFYDKNEEFIKYCFVSLVCTGILYLVFFIINGSRQSFSDTFALLLSHIALRQTASIMPEKPVRLPRTDFPQFCSETNFRQIFITFQEDPWYSGRFRLPYQRTPSILWPRTEIRKNPYRLQGQAFR